MYRALLKMYRALLKMYRALLKMYRALLKREATCPSPIGLSYTRVLLRVQ